VQSHYLSYDADLILVVLVLLLLVIGRLLVQRTQRHSENARSRDGGGRLRRKPRPPVPGLTLPRP
jgi:hypothetical protein